MYRFNKMYQDTFVISGRAERLLLSAELDATDREIDKLVYGLYGLTEEDIGIVEGKAVASELTA